MKKDLLEIKLMELEVRLDRLQNEARKALGIVRVLLEYHSPHRQKTLRSYGVWPSWSQHHPKYRGSQKEDHPR